jgi:DNA-binding transcriptional MocR family regulator
MVDPAGGSGDPGAPGGPADGTKYSDIKTLHRYQQVARRYAAAIEGGTLAAGERFPSVRRMAAEEQVSVATVLQALAQLERLGLVEARPRSGHFVRHRARAPEPRGERPHAVASDVSVSELVRKIYRAANDPSIVQLGSAVPSTELLPAAALSRAVASSMRHPRDGGLGYQMPPGLPELRRMIAQRALHWGMTISEDDVVITSGATEAVHLSLLATTRPGDVVAMESPAYYGTLQVAEALGLKVLGIPCHPATGLDVDALAERLDQLEVAAVVATPSYSNPLGSCMPDAARERLVRLLSGRGVPLIEDDVYGELAFDAARVNPAKAWDRDSTVLLCSSFTKTLAPGFRIGFVVPGRRWQEQVERLKFVTNVASPTLPQRALARYLSDGAYDRHLRTLRDRLSGIEASTASAVARHFPAGTRVSSPRGGCFLWVELPDGLDAMALHARALDVGVAISPGPIFSPQGGHRSCIRLSCGLPWTGEVEAAVKLVGRLAGKLLRGAAESPFDERRD